MAVPVVIMAVMAAASAVAAAGAVKAGADQATVASYNAQVQQSRAGQAQLDSQAQAQIGQQKTKEQLATAEASYGAAGVSSDAGTPLEMMSSLAAKGELNRQLTLFQGKMGALADNEQSAIDRAQSQSAKSTSYFQAGSSLLSGVSSSMMAGQKMGALSAGSSPANG